MKTLPVYHRSIFIMLCILIQPILYGQDTLFIGHNQGIQLNELYNDDGQAFDLSTRAVPERFKAYTTEFIVKNPLPIDTTVDLYIPSVKVSLNIKRDGKVVSTQRIGDYQSGNAYPSFFMYAPLNLKANEVLTVELIQENYFLFASRPLQVELRPLKIKSENKMRALFSNKYAYTISLLFQGAIFFMMIYVLFMYFLNKKRMYLFYALYMFGVGMYYYMRIDRFFGFNLFFPTFPEAVVILNQPIQLLFFVFYSLFVIDFLDLKKNDNSLYKQIWCAIILYIFGALFISFYISMTGDELSVLNWMPYTFGAITLFSLYAVIRLLFTGPSGLTRYIVAGTGLLTVFSFIALLLSFGVIGSDFKLWSINIFPINYSQIGTLLEILCFSLGLGYKMRKDHEASKVAQEQVIEFHKQNRRLAEELNQDLEEKVQDRAEKIEQQALLLEQEKASRLKEEYDKKLSLMEMAALKAQMNPHFVFNALNSMKQLVISGQQDKAVSYLSKFSKLMRNILNSSADSKTSLADELETCKLYMEIESNRFADNFDFSIEVEQGVDPSFISLPSMLLQPYVENAIWHGLLHKEGARELKIQVSRGSNEVVVKIKDNGIGREASTRIQSKRATKSKSYGMQISSDRINLYNQLYDSNIKQYINDKVGKDSTALGTDVVLHIPIDD